MPFGDGELGELKQALGVDVPLGMLLDINNPYLETPIAEWRKRFIGQPGAGRTELASLIVDEFARADMVPSLALNLYRKLYKDPVLAPKLLYFTRSPDEPEQLQAALEARTRSMSFLPARQFWNEAAPRICAVVVPKMGETRLGTGFLVAPDMIVTAFHTVSHLVHDGKPRAGIEPVAVFDFYRGVKIKGLTPRDVGRWIPFHEDWLVTWSGHLSWDGRVDIPDPEQTEALRSNLDFALIRLAQPVGHEISQENGGRRRQWFEVTSNPPQLQPGQRLSIPQHPAGYPQTIDFGVFVTECPSAARIRYDVESFPGTSGAPCFALEGDAFPLVGMHNAAYIPKPGGQATNLRGVAVLNQAVRFDLIAARILPLLTSSEQRPPARFWNLSQSLKEPVPIIGRELLIEWISQASRTAPPSTTFAATGSGRKIGRAFSVSILRAMRRNSSDLVVELGTSVNSIPATVQDTVQAILDQLSISPEGMPQRPDPGITAEPDKLSRWASTDVPRWLLAELCAHRAAPAQGGGTDAGRAQLVHARGLRRPPITPNEDDWEKDGPLPRQVGEVQPLQVADQPSPPRWERLWIAIRLKSEDELRSEVGEFLAGLRNAQAEDATFEVAAPMRWLFLGALPDAIGSIDEAFHEDLDPMKFGIEQCEGTFMAIADSLARPLTAQHIQGFRIGFGVALNLLNDREARLRQLQELMSKCAARIEESPL